MDLHFLSEWVLISPAGRNWRLAELDGGFRRKGLQKSIFWEIRSWRPTRTVQIQPDGSVTLSVRLPGKK
jgi:hypothetical protein